MDSRKKLYDEGFFKSVKDINMRFAETLVPIVSQFADIKSVVDFGCGVGCWLKAFSDCNSLDYMTGYDGEWLRGNELLVDENDIIYTDLSNRVVTEKKYDLVISLEVAEHCPDTSADVFIQNLTSAGNLVLFSAAIPWQGGVGHINERWQDYWSEIFLKYGFECHDVLRPLCWDNEDAGIYRQNVFFYVKQSQKHNYPKIINADHNASTMRNMVMPTLYDTLMKKNDSLLRTLMDLYVKESMGRGLSNYLKMRNIHEVAVYGMADFGKAVAGYLYNSGVKVTCGIDQKKMDSIEIGEGIPIFRPHELEGHKPEIVIVTVPNAFETIKRTLDSIDGNSEYIDIHRLVEEL